MSFSNKCASIIGMSPSLIRHLVDVKLTERQIEEGSTKLKQVAVRIHPGIYGLLERIALEVGKSPTGTAQMLLVAGIVEAADKLGMDLEVELNPTELLAEYPWMFQVTDIKMVEPEKEVAE